MSKLTMWFLNKVGMSPQRLLKDLLKDDKLQQDIIDIMTSKQTQQRVMKILSQVWSNEEIRNMIEDKTCAILNRQDREILLFFENYAHTMDSRLSRIEDNQKTILLNQEMLK